MKDNNYVVIQGWMINRLKLSGNELMAYAIIYGFSQDDKTKFMGSGQYIADSAGISRRAVTIILNNLTKKGYIKKYKHEENGVKRCDYSVAAEHVFDEKKNKCGTGGMEKFAIPMEKDSIGGMEKFAIPMEKDSIGGMEKFANHNTSLDNIFINQYNNTGSSAEPPVSESQKQAYELSELLLETHRAEIPDYLSGKDDKKTIERWAADIEMLIRIDKKPPETIRQVILWAKSPGSFWFPNIQSGKKLREKYETLYSQMARSTGPPKKNAAPPGLKDKKSLGGLEIWPTGM